MKRYYYLKNKMNVYSNNTYLLQPMMSLYWGIPSKHSGSANRNMLSRYAIRIQSINPEELMYLTTDMQKTGSVNYRSICTFGEYSQLDKTKFVCSKR